MGDCSIGVSLDALSGLIIAARVGKHSDRFLEELILNTKGKIVITSLSLKDGANPLFLIFLPWLI